MSLTLDGTLQTAQDSQTHKPIVKLLSSQWAADIPFDGQFLTSETTDEINPLVNVHSTGRLFLVYGLGANLHYVYTDTARTAFTHVSFDTTDTFVEASACEMTNGNIGIIYCYSAGGSYYVRYKIISVTGTQVADDAIFNQLTSVYLSGPFVMKLADDTYLMVYGKQSGSDYYIYKRTAESTPTNFTTWSAESQLSIGGLTSTKRKGNPSLEQITTGDIWLTFDYLESTGASGEELTNIYYSVSSDSGGTWSNATQLTTYADYMAAGRHPVIVQKEADSLHVIYTEISQMLHIGSGTSGWCMSNSVVRRFAIDYTGHMLYVQVTFAGGIGGVVEIDLDTWLITNCWECDTIPAFSADCLCGGIGDVPTPYYSKPDGYYVPIILSGKTEIEVLNADNDTITQYIFKAHNQGDCQLTPNVDWTPYQTAGYEIEYCQVEASANKLWVILHSWDVSSNNYYQVGYVDLTESPDPLYTWNESCVIDASDLTRCGYADPRAIYPDYNYVMCGVGDSGGNGSFCIYDLQTGALIWGWNNTDTDFHDSGTRNFVYDHSSHKVFASFHYMAGSGQGDRRGLMIIDLNSETITYSRPTWASYDEYYLYGITVNDAGEVWIASTYGITLFNPEDSTWTLYDYTDYNPNSDQYDIIYDESSDMVIAASKKAGSNGLIMFSRYGSIKQSQYMIGTYSGSWSFDSANPLVQGYIDYDASICFDPSDSSMYAFWINTDGTEESIKWDKEIAEVNLASYLVRGTDVIADWDIDRITAELNFMLSHGYLFDPSNLNSLLSPYVKKGMKLALYFGENIASVDYWQEQGTFSVREVALSYQRGQYPVMTVKASDETEIWDEMEVIATDSYSDYPEDIIKDVVPENSSMILANIDLPVFTGRNLLYQQWIDTSLKDIVQQVCDRFGYYPRINVLGKLDARLISDALTRSPDHTYSNTAKLINYTPDDSFSSYINKIVITGFERTFNEVTFAEERIKTMNGSFGWWVSKKDFTVYYSEDQSRRCVNPRLNVLESAENIMWQMAGGVTESITYEDPDHKYCVVTIDAPTEAAIAALAASIGLYIAGAILTEPDAPSAGDPHWHARVGTTLCDVALFMAVYVLGSVTNYQFEIYARPLGTMKRTVQAEWNDYELQNLLDMEVTKKYEDPLCYTVLDCQTVANFEGMITQLQRKRVKLQKVSHLQDEVGDIIQIPHPYTNDSLRIFITNLRRIWHISEGNEDQQGCIDEIEGWRVT